MEHSSVDDVFIPACFPQISVARFSTFGSRQMRNMWCEISTEKMKTAAVWSDDRKGYGGQAEGSNMSVLSAIKHQLGVLKLLGSQLVNLRMESR